MAWLGTWRLRTKLIIDHDDISAALVNFPVLLYLSASSGRGSDDLTFVFDELASDGNRKKIAVTTSDGETECYVEISEWSDADEKAVLWVKVPAVAADADTELYLYYDIYHAANTAHVGDPSDAVVHNVWDSSFKLVSHMRDDPDTSHTRDSTVSANDGTKKAANEPQAVAAGQDFDGVDDYVNHGNAASLQLPNGITLEARIVFDDVLNYQRIISKWAVGGTYDYLLMIDQTTGLLAFYVDDSTLYAIKSTDALGAGVTYNVAATRSGTTLTLYVNGVPVDTNEDGPVSYTPGTDELWVGDYRPDPVRQPFKGIINEVRVSGTARTAAWLKASHESMVDDLLGWETEEVKFVGAPTGILQIEVTIESPYGTKLGAGPIVTALNWRNSPPLDGIGSFEFEMPVTDPRVSLVAKKRYARCHGLLGGSWQELGKAGIIDDIKTVIQPGQDPTLRVSGGDLLRELTYRQVGYLELVETDAAWTTPGWVKYQNGTDYGNGPPFGPSRDLPEAFDDDVLTEEEVGFFYNSAWPTQTTYVYIGYPVRTAGIKFILGNSKNNEEVNSLVQYFNGSIWAGVAVFVDGTKVGNATLAQDGEMTFTKPATHEKTTHDGVEAYWLRLSSCNNYGTDAVDLVEVDVLAEGPTTEGLVDIMAFAPAGWSVDTVNGYATTGQAIYTRFKGENVLEALRILAELTGEHFRLGVGRKVVWIRNDPVDDPTACGYRAVPMYGASVEENLGICVIQQLTEVEDSREECNRIYPYGAGSYPNRIDLTSATEDVPEGYSVYPGQNFVQHDASAQTLLIMKSMVWPEISLLGEGGAHPALAANQLLAAALAYLKQHKDLGKSYDLAVIGLAGLVEPGETIPVQYWQYVGGILVLDIDATLIILEPTIEITQDGLYTVALTVSTTDAWPATMEKTVADWLIEVRRGLAG